MASKPRGPGRDGSPARRLGATVAGVSLFAAGLYLLFAAVVMAVLALTDPTGFVTNARSVGLFVILLGSGLALGHFGRRTLRKRRRDHPPTPDRRTGAPRA